MKIGLALLLLLPLADNSSEFGRVLSKTRKQKQYRFSISGGGLDISGTYEKGAVHMTAGSYEVAGRGGLTHGKGEKGWTRLSSLIQRTSEKDELRKLSKVQPAHTILGFLSRYLDRVEGDAGSGFSADLRRGNLSDLAKSPWIASDDLEKAGNITGSVSFDVVAGLIVRVELKMRGSMTDWQRQKRRQPGAPPPRNQHPGMQKGPDGRDYKPVEKSVSVTITITLSEFGSATINGDARTAVGLK